MTRTSWLVAFCLLQSCQFHIPENKLACDEQTRCPNGWQCVTGHCVSSGTPSTADASTDSGPVPIIPDDAKTSFDNRPDTGPTPPPSGPEAGVMPDQACVLGHATLGACLLQ